MQKDNNRDLGNGTAGDYATIQPVPYRMKDLQSMMKQRNNAELATLKAVNSLAKEPYIKVSRMQAKWNTIKNLAIFASIVPLLITLLIYFISPMLTQDKFAFDDVRVYGMTILFALVAVAVAIIIDIGRANILDKSNNGFKNWFLYTFVSVCSVLITTTGMLAVADFYASKEAGETATAVKDAKAYMLANGGVRSVEAIDKEQQEKDKLYKQRGSGYGWSAWNRDSKRLSAERAKAEKLANAKSLLDNKRSIQSNDNSSNWLFNTYAKIANSTVIFAAVLIGLAFNFLSELMAYIAHFRLIRINARLEVTDQHWDNATMAANEAMIVGNSTLSQLNHIDQFVHNFKMPLHVLNSYQNNEKKLGEFSNSGREDIGAIRVVDDNGLTAKQQGMKELYRVAQNSKVGEAISCPACNQKLKKKSHNHIFCSSKGKNNCKDVYHNMVEPERLKYAK